MRGTWSLLSYRSVACLCGRLQFPAAAAAVVRQGREPVTFDVRAVSVGLAAVALVDARLRHNLTGVADAPAFIAHTSCLRHGGTVCDPEMPHEARGPVRGRRTRAKCGALASGRRRQQALRPFTLRAGPSGPQRLRQRLIPKALASLSGRREPLERGFQLRLSQVCGVDPTPRTRSLTRWPPAQGYTAGD